MTSPDGLNSDAAQVFQTLKANASRMGLTWEVTMATVVDATDPGNVQAVFDGDADANSQGLISMIGNPGAGQRVYVFSAPPAGQYIVGRAAAGNWVHRLTLGVAQPSVTFPIPANLRSLHVEWSARVSAAAGFAQMIARINGVATASYASTYLQAIGTTVSAVSPAVTGLHFGFVPGSDIARIKGSGAADFQAWDLIAGASLSEVFRSIDPSNLLYNNGGGAYAGPGPFTSLTLMPNAGGGNFVVGSDFQLSGVGP